MNRDFTERFEDSDYKYITDYGRYDPVMCGNADAFVDAGFVHDRGLLRALNSNYRTNKLVKGDPTRTLFVGSLNYSTSEKTLKEVFSRYGKIKRLRLVRDIVTGFSKGYAFIEFESMSDVRDAYRQQRLIVDGRELLIDYEHERLLPGWKPRRLGGGLGGRKESGQIRFGGRYKPFNKLHRRSNSFQRPSNLRDSKRPSRQDSV